MPIKFRCPHCRQFLGISRSKAGALTDCPTCGRTIRIPDLEGKVQPLPKPEFNLGDSELAGALDALARLDAPGAPPSSPLAGGAIEFPEGEDHRSRPAVVAVAVSGVQELAPLPAPKPVALEPALLAQHADTSSPPSAPRVAAANALDEIISLNPAAARSATSPAARSPSGLLVAILFVGAAAIFGVGFMVGRTTAPVGDATTFGQNSNSHPSSSGLAVESEPIPPEPATDRIPALSGRLTYATADGGIEPDVGARVIVLPEEREGTVKLPVPGFRAGAGDADRVLSQTSIRALGGDYVVANERGEYTVRLANAGNYRALFLSRFQPRDDAEFLEPTLQEALSNYFQQPAALVGPVAYEFADFTFRGDKAVPRDYVFERE